MVMVITLRNLYEDIKHFFFLLAHLDSVCADYKACYPQHKCKKLCASQSRKFSSITHLQICKCDLILFSFPIQMPSQLQVSHRALQTVLLRTGYSTLLNSSSVFLMVCFDANVIVVFKRTDFFSLTISTWFPCALKDKCPCKTPGTC